MPLARRRRSALVAGAFALVLLVAGLLPWVTPADSVIRFLAAFVVVAGLFAAFIAVGLVRSIRRVPVTRGTSARAGAAGGCGGGCQCGRQDAGC